jgi:DNA-binding MarR family transcriptional regulator
MDPTDTVSKTAIDLAGQLRHSALRLLRVLRAHQPAEGLSASKLALLGYLDREGPATATGLAVYLRVQPQSLTRLIAGLEKRQWIARRPNAEDRRQSVLNITDAGARLLRQAIQNQQARLARAITGALTPAEQELLRISAGLMDKLAAATHAPADDPAG